MNRGRIDRYKNFAKSASSRFFLPLPHVKKFSSENSGIPSVNEARRWKSTNVETYFNAIKDSSLKLMLLSYTNLVRELNMLVNKIMFESNILINNLLIWRGELVTLKRVRKEWKGKRGGEKERKMERKNIEKEGCM